MTPRQTAEARLGRLLMISAAVGLVAAALSVAWALFDAGQVFRSYLAAYLFWWQVGIGCLGLELLGRMTGGAWAHVARPFFRAGILTLPLLALLWIPIGVGLDEIYVWTREDYFAGLEHAHHRELWYDRTFYLLRAAGYFACWIGMGLALIVFARRTTDREAAKRRARWGALNGVGLVVLALTVTLASFDWVMSLDPRWHSTAIGAVVFVGAGLAALALAAAGVGFLLVRPKGPEVEPSQILGDLGNLLLAFIMLWAYLAFSQFLIIWSGNLPGEVRWYVARSEGSWRWLGASLMVLHFALPFVLLLSRDVKRQPFRLATVATAVLLIHYLELFWTVAPAYRARLSVHPLDALEFIAVGGLWLGIFAWQLKRQIVPVFEDYIV